MTVTTKEFAAKSNSRTSVGGWEINRTISKRPGMPGGCFVVALWFIGRQP